MNISGTKCDLTVGINVVTVEEGEKLRRKLNINQFVECSAKDNKNINQVIHEAVRATMAGPLPPRKKGAAQFVKKVFCCNSK